MAEEKKVPVLLSVIGAATYSLLRNLVSPLLPKDVSYKDLSSKLKSHFEPQPIVIAERYHFHRRNQAVDESFAEYIAELRRLSTHCKFGAYLEDALRDRLVCGLRNEAIRKRLLSEADLKLATALEMSQRLEMAEKNAQQFKATDPPVNRVEVPCKHKACYRCGEKNHKAEQCRFRELSCHNCGKKGHLRKMCRSPHKKKLPSHKVKKVSDEDTDEEEILTILHLGKPSTKPIQVELKVNDKPLTFEVDTGASVSLVSEQKLRKVLPHLKLKKANVALRTYTAEEIPLLGETELEVQYGRQRERLTLYVVKGKWSLTCRLSHIKLDWKEIKLTREEETTQTSLEGLLEEYQEVFNEELGTMKEIKAKLHVKEGSVPKFHRPRPVPYAMRQPVEDEIHRLEREGILRKVDHSEWAAPVVPVPKKNGQVRLCGDYKVTINSALEVDQHPFPKPEDLFATLNNGKKFTKIDLARAYHQMLVTPEST